ncbi:MAG: peptidylprolyl isomerase [Bacteroidota bacterium]
MHATTLVFRDLVYLLVGLLFTACTPKGENRMSQIPPDSSRTARTIAVIETSLGTIEAQLYPDDAPNTVANFVGLAEQKYYDGVKFHRVSKGFVIQGGDPTGTGAGGKTLTGKTLEDELNPTAPSYQAGYLKGVLAMANKGRPGTGTSQFFIMLEDNVRLPKAYTIFGRVIKGMNVVDAIGNVDIIPNPQMGPRDGEPKTPVIMKTVRIRRDSAEPAEAGH